ncbi:hypothetical protein GNT15_04730 [Vibrio parahaemolyticus]|nr:hypothetical protein [Vibrio parahaemolyticus]EJG0732082.1 hypothetical protein [Vibrio parahaemolyticus]EJG0787479.1 hypothetical protein [Vibrio parahaemolyticus]
MVKIFKFQEVEKVSESPQQSETEKAERHESVTNSNTTQPSESKHSIAEIKGGSTEEYATHSSDIKPSAIESEASTPAVPTILDPNDKIAVSQNVGTESDTGEALLESAFLCTFKQGEKNILRCSPKQTNIELAVHDENVNKAVNLDDAKPSVKKTNFTCSIEQGENQAMLCRHSDDEKITDVLEYGNSFFLLTLIVITVAYKLLPKSHYDKLVFAMLGGTFVFATYLIAGVISKLDIDDLSQYPATWLLLLVGVSLGINLISDWLTSERGNPNKEEHDKLKEEHDKLKKEHSKLGMDYKELTEERSRYKGELLKIQTQVTNALNHDNSAPSKCIKTHM